MGKWQWIPVIITSWTKEGVFRSTLKFMLKKNHQPVSNSVPRQYLLVPSAGSSWKTDEAGMKRMTRRRIHYTAFILWTLKFTWAMFLGCVYQIRFCRVHIWGFVNYSVCSLAHSFIRSFTHSFKEDLELSVSPVSKSRHVRRCDQLTSLSGLARR